MSFESISEKPPVYNDKGQVNDIETARVGAKIELEARNKRSLFGLVGPSKESIEWEKVNAGIAMEEATEVELKELPSLVQQEIEKQSENIKDGKAILLKEFKVVVSTNTKLKNIYISDIGGGISKYRVIFEREDISNNPMMIPELSYSSGQIIIDVKNDEILKSDIEYING